MSTLNTADEPIKRKRIAVSKLTSEEHLVYKTWSGMIQRCFNKNNPAYENYGGRGITVCKEWQYDFWAFYNHVGNKPEPHGLYSIDRIDNDGNYESGNVRWATRSQQNYNQRVRKSNFGQIKGVTWSDANCGWQAERTLDGKKHYIGWFNNQNDAVQALIDFQVEYRLSTERQKAAVKELEKTHKAIDDTVIFITNDLPSLLALDDTVKIREQHKKELHKNIDERIEQLQQGSTDE